MGGKWTPVFEFAEIDTIRHIFYGYCNSADYRVHCAKCTLHNSQCTKYTAHSWQNVHSSQCTENNPQFTVYTENTVQLAECAKWTIHSSQFTVYTENTVHSWENVQSAQELISNAALGPVVVCPLLGMEPPPLSSPLTRS